MAIRAQYGPRVVAADPGVIRAADFRPHRFLRNPHIQMFAGALLRYGRNLPVRMERSETPDGDFIELGWINEQGDGPLAVLVHGIGGDLDSGYLHSMAACLAQRRWTSVLLQMRGAGPEPNLTPRTYHHGDTEDFRGVLQQLRKRFPERRLNAIGWSMGASVVIKALGEEGANSPISRAAVISAPLQLRRCAEHLSSGTARLYQSLMLWRIKQILARKHRVSPLPYNMPAVRAARDFFELGEVYTAPMSGFRNADEYYECVNPGRYLQLIRRPTLIVQAKDDPLLGPAALPALPASPWVQIEVANEGGHIGFVSEDHDGRPTSWLEPHVADFLMTAH